MSKALQAAQQQRLVVNSSKSIKNPNNSGQAYLGIGKPSAAVSEPTEALISPDLEHSDLLPRTGHIRLRKSGWVEIHKIAWQTALAGHHPATNAVENDYSPVSRFRSFLGRLEAT